MSSLRPGLILCFYQISSFSNSSLLFHSVILLLSYFSDSVHDDIQLCQWLRTKDGVIKLGDFNRAEVMDYNEKDEKYCEYYNGSCYGNVSSLYFGFRHNFPCVKSLLTCVNIIFVITCSFLTYASGYSLTYSVVSCPGRIR